jgi:hypothetical protein
MAVTFSASGITYSDGKIQRYAGIGSSTYINRGATLFAPRWVATSRSQNTFYYPSSSVEEVCFVSVIVQIGGPDGVAYLYVRSPSGTNSIVARSEWQLSTDSPTTTLSTILPSNWGWQISCGGNASVVSTAEFLSN